MTSSQTRPEGKTPLVVTASTRPSCPHLSLSPPPPQPISDVSWEGLVSTVSRRALDADTASWLLLPFAIASVSILEKLSVADCLTCGFQDSNHTAHPLLSPSKGTKGGLLPMDQQSVRGQLLGQASKKLMNKELSPGPEELLVRRMHLLPH